MVGGEKSRNTSRLILDTVGPVLLAEVVGDLLDPLETSCAVYERNGDTAMNQRSSGWCRLLAPSSRQHEETSSSRPAPEADRGRCHESCWNGAALLSMETGMPTDLECPGGMRLFAVPIRDGEETFGCISIGYGDPPRDPKRLQELAATHGIDMDELRRMAHAHESRPGNVVASAKKRGHLSARLIGEIVKRKQAEQALRESEEKYSAVVQQAKDGVVLIQDERLRFVNAAMADILGYSPAEMENQPFVDYLAPDQRSMVAARVKARLAGENVPSVYETRLLHNNGSFVDVELSGSALQYRGRPADAVIVRDVGGRKLAEDALRHSEEAYRLLFEQSVDGIVISVGRKIVAANSAFCALHGFPLDRITGMDPLGLILPDDRPMAIERLRCLQSGEHIVESYTYRSFRQGDSPLWVEVLSKPIKWGGQPAIQSIVRDVTERKRAEEALRESEARFRQMVEFSPLPIAITTEEGAVEYLNPKFVDTLGYTLEDVPSLAEWYGLAYPDMAYRQVLKEKWQEALEAAAARNSATRNIDAEVVCKDASRRSMEILATTVGNKMVSVFNDLTERKRAEAEHARFESQMREMQKFESLGVLAGGIAHHFNNLLMTILGNADLALLRLPAASTAHHNLAEITRAAQRAADLCGQMLACSGKGQYKVGRCDLSKIVHEMAQILEVSISKKASLRYSLAESLPAVEADATQIRQIVMNLISNASEALGDHHGIITISSGVTACDRACLPKNNLDDNLPEGQYVTLEVSDTGCGMDADTVSKIFDPFFTTKFLGRGLGLPAVHGIVRAHKGAIRVSSKPGEGTTVKILLPAGEWLPGEMGQDEKLDGLPRKGCILLVENDSAVREVGSEMLTMLGFRVLSASDGDEGVGVFRAHRDEIDCVILEVTTPGAAEESTFQELRRLRGDVRVILSSGYREQEMSQRFAGRGPAGFITKPYTVANLLETLNRAFR